MTVLKVVTAVVSTTRRYYCFLKTWAFCTVKTKMGVVAFVSTVRLNKARVRYGGAGDQMTAKWFATVLWLLCGLHLSVSPLLKVD
jgi:hypothetical protein